MASATGSPAQTGTPTISSPVGTTDIKRIRMELSSLEKEIQTVDPSDSEKFIRLERSLATLDGDIRDGVKHTRGTDKKLLMTYGRDVEVHQKTLSHMKFNGSSYQDAVMLAEGEVGGYDRGKGWKIAAITGSLLAVGALGALAYNAWVADNAQGAIQEGDRLEAFTAFQGADPTITPPVDAASVAAADIQKIMKPTPYNLDAQIFFRDVYPNLDPKLQNYLVPAADANMLFDSLPVTKDNPEVKNIRVFADKIGGMQIAFDGERVTEEGAIQPYIGRPQAILDSQAHAILTKYPGAK